MSGYVRLGVISALLLILSLPFPALAQSFGVSPAEVRIDNLSPGERAEFYLTIYNKDEAARIFVLTTFQPSEQDRKEGRAKFPDAGWVSFSPQQVEAPAKSEARVKVTVRVPRDEKWADKDWEIWLTVSSESAELLAVQYYVRLLVSTASTTVHKPSTRLIMGIILGFITFAYAIYYCLRLRHRAKSS